MPPQSRKDARRLLRRSAEYVVGGLGYELVAKHFYSPIPDLSALPDDVWDRRSDLAGVRFPEDAGLAYVEEELAHFLPEFRPPRRPTGDARTFYVENTLYEDVDADLLWAMVRRHEPRRVLELGSGMSTLVIADALVRNATRGSTHVVCDPYPRSDLPLAQVADLRAIPATDVPRNLITELEPGDILFVDTTHTVKTGGDVNHIVLDLLPHVPPGVVVHVHDIYLPYEYPREFLAERRFFWAEQYLLQAFLAFNDAFEVLCSAYALVRDQPEAIRRLVPGATASTRPGALWMRRRS